MQLTKSETAISNFAWSEDGKQIAYTATEPVPQVSKDRKEYLGDYEVVRKEYNYVHLWTLNVSEALSAPVIGKQHTKKKDFSVDSFAWSPDGQRLAFSATVNPDLIQGVTSDIYLLNLADDSVKKLVAQPGPDSGPRFSPDGTQIVFSSAMGNTTYFASNSRLAIVPVAAARRVQSRMASMKTRGSSIGKRMASIFQACKKRPRIFSALIRPAQRSRAFPGRTV